MQRPDVLDGVDDGHVPVRALELPQQRLPLCGTEQLRSGTCCRSQGEHSASSSGGVRCVVQRMPPAKSLTFIADGLVDDRSKVALLPYGVGGVQLHKSQTRTLGAAPESGTEVLRCLRGRRYELASWSGMQLSLHC